MYKAWLCYPHTYEDDEDEQEPCILFKQPRQYLYKQVIEINFNIVHRWANADRKLYE
jgi:hypothetical protein